MGRKKGPDAESLKKALTRANPRALFIALLAFQFAAMLLLAFKSGAVDYQALIMAVAMPVASVVITRVFIMLWPIDRTLLTLILFLCSVSLISLKDIARAPSTSMDQGIYMLAGFVAMGAGCQIIRLNFSWRKLSPYLYILCVLALLSPWALGKWQYGARNWISVLGVSAQPSEFVKPMLVVFLAAQLNNRPSFRRSAFAVALAAGLCAILLAERDLGALLIYFLTVVAMYYAASSNLALSLAGLGMGAAGAVAAYQFLPYLRKRIAVFVNPWSDPTDSGYQIVQALIAIGSGGFFGTGLGLGMPRTIPLYHSDFIFAAICEEFGLVFAICLIAVYALIFMRAMSVAMNARTSFHSLVAFGTAFMLAVQTLIIVGGNIHLIPLTGVTLPLISAGGSSIVGTMGGLGLLLGISSLNAQAEARDLGRLEWREGAIE